MVTSFIILSGSFTFTNLSTFDTIGLEDGNSAKNGGRSDTLCKRLCANHDGFLTQKGLDAFDKKSIEVSSLRMQVY